MNIDEVRDENYIRSTYSIIAKKTRREKEIKVTRKIVVVRRRNQQQEQHCQAAHEL